MEFNPSLFTVDGMVKYHVSFSKYHVKLNEVSCLSLSPSRLYARIMGHGLLWHYVALGKASYP